METPKSYPMPKVGLLEWAWSGLRTHGHEGELFWAALLLTGITTGALRQMAGGD